MIERGVKGFSNRITASDSKRTIKENSYSISQLTIQPLTLQASRYLCKFGSI